MKITSVLKTIILTGAITILTSIPTFASEQEPQVIDHYTTMDNEIITVYENNTYYTNFDTNIQSISYIDNSITIEKDNNLYSFYVDDPRNYYLSEKINITMDQNNEIIDCSITEQPQVYNTTISQIKDNTAFLIANGNKI